MIGRRQLPTAYREWNERWAAPYGLEKACAETPIRERPHADDPSRYGMFGFQGNNDTRTVEYPWVYHAGQFAPGMRVLEIGGGLSGLQFVLGSEGCTVVNVDPGTDPDHAWQGSPLDHEKLNMAFGTDVELVLADGQDYDDTPASFDRAYCVSVIEHVGTEAANATMRRIARLLKPGGLAVMTVDLSLDIHPFTERQSNDIGANQNIAELVAASGLDLVAGYRDELFGHPEFDPEDIRRRTAEFHVGEFRIPVVAQMFVLRKRP